MKEKPDFCMEEHRIKHGEMASDESYGNNGCFLFPGKGVKLAVIVSDQGDWEHLSVHIRSKRGDRVIKRTPTWEEMCYLKNLFWEKDEVVMQLHPAEEDYVNVHDYVLHLWKPKSQAIPLPPKVFV